MIIVLTIQIKIINQIFKKKVLNNLINNIKNITN